MDIIITIIPIIPISIPIALLTICCMFIVFKLPWIRQEIDNYRNRIASNDKGHEYEYLENTDEEFKNKVIPTISRMLFTRSDNYFDNLKKTRLDTIDLFMNSVSLFKKRFKQKRSILNFFIASIFVFIISFICPILYIFAIIGIFYWLYKLLKNDY